MDHSGTVVSTLRHSSIPPPTDENHVQYLACGVTKYAKCCKPYLNPRDRSLLQTFSMAIWAVAIHAQIHKKIASHTIRMWS